VSSSKLTPRRFEIVRMQIAQINDTRVCQSYHLPHDVVGRFAEDSVPEMVYEHVGDPTWPGISGCASTVWSSPSGWCSTISP
jgi:hypothetical protein